MKKKMTFGLALVLSPIPFSFFKMEGTYKSIDYPNLQPYNNLPNGATIFVYDPNTFLRLEYTFKDLNKSNRYFASKARNLNEMEPRTGYFVIDKDNEIIYDSNKPLTPATFIDCQFDYNKKFWSYFTHDDNCTYTYNFKSKFKKNKLYLIKQDINSHNREYVSPIEMRSKFKSWSGIEIDNTGEEVMLRLDKEKIPLKKALEQYFFPTSLRNTINQNFATQFTTYNKISDSKEKYKFFMTNVNPLLKYLKTESLFDENFKLLTESKILAVWCLVPNKIKIGEKEEIVESQLVGIAKGKDGKLFHWDTSLKEDISILFPKKENIIDKMIKKAEVFYNQYMTRDLNHSNRVSKTSN